MSAKTTFEAVNTIGKVLHTFSDPDLARAWARQNASQWPGVTVEEVTVTTTRRKLWTDHKWASFFREAQLSAQERLARSVERQGEAA